MKTAIQSFLLSTAPCTMFDAKRFRPKVRLGIKKRFRPKVRLGIKKRFRPKVRFGIKKRRTLATNGVKAAWLSV
jgi:hypothetical protein